MKPRILVVDDDAAVLQSCTTILEDEGFEVEVAATPQAGLDLLRQQRFALALTDLKLPGGLSGLEVSSAPPRSRPTWWSSS